MHNLDSAYCISYSSEGKKDFKLPINDYKIEIGELQPQSRTFIILEVVATKPKNTGQPNGRISFRSILEKQADDKKTNSVLIRLMTITEKYDFTATLRYTKNNQTKEEKSHSELEYVEPLNIIKNIHKKGGKYFLQLIILNCSRISLKIVQWEISGCKIVSDPNTKNQYVGTGQQFHMAFVLTELECPILLIQYCALRKNDSRMHVDPLIDNRMRYQTFTMVKELLPEQVACIRNSEPLELKKKCLIYITTFTNKIVKVRIEYSKNWEFAEGSDGTFEGFTENELIMEIIPKKCGPQELPEIIVWVDGRQVKVEGNMKVFIFPNCL